MKILIEKQTLVEDVKKTFTSYYPYLKIELYKTMSDGKQSHTKKEMLPSNFVFGKLLKVDKAIIDAGKNITVAELESEFANISLHAEIFRKSGSVWVETSLTRNWTLQQQNTEAEEISHHVY